MMAVEAVKEKFYCFLGIVHPTLTRCSQTCISHTLHLKSQDRLGKVKQAVDATLSDQMQHQVDINLPKHQPSKHLFRQQVSSCHCQHQNGFEFISWFTINLQIKHVFADATQKVEQDWGDNSRSATIIKITRHFFIKENFYLFFVQFCIRRKTL